MDAQPERALGREHLTPDGHPGERDPDFPAPPGAGVRLLLQGILRLGKRYGDDRLEAARTRAVAFQAFSYRSVESILRRGLDRQPLPPPTPVTTTPRHHEYVCGAAYYP